VALHEIFESCMMTGKNSMMDRRAAF